MVKVEQLMRKDLVSVDAGTSVVEAAKLMRSYNIGSVLVSQQGRIVGIVTESDVVKKFVGAEKVPFFLPVEHIMSSPVVGIEGNRPVTLPFSSRNSMDATPSESTLSRSLVRPCGSLRFTTDAFCTVRPT